VNSLGEYLKKEREARSISLEEISKATKIRKVFLEAIEDGCIEKLPDEVFVKGFLHAYSKCLGLNNEEIVVRYKSYIDSSKSAEEKETPPPQKSRFSMSLIIVSSVILFSIFCILIYLGQRKKEEVTIVPSVTSNETKAPSPISKKPVDKPILTKESDEGVSTEDKTPEESSSTISLVNDEKEEPEEEKTLSVKANEMTWLRIQIDTDLPVEFTLKPGDSVTWRASNTFNLLIGNAGGVDIYYNGKEIDNLGNSGKVVSLTLPNEEFR